MIYQTEDKLDYEAKILKAAKDGNPPDHDCTLEADSGCPVCEGYAEARAWWLEQEANLNNEKLI